MEEKFQSNFSEVNVIKYYIQLHFLIIDDVGIQFNNEEEKLILFKIINTRYESMKPTIMINNLLLGELS
ncbi:MAG: ATP-binding protein [Arsenophonus sp. NC-CH8-MAG3]